jgi:ABC-type ATPase involved in cell division
LHLLKNINTSGTAIVMATHNYDLVRQTNERVLQIHGGKISETRL